MSLKDYKDLVLNAAWMWSEDRAPSMGAAIAYYTIFSLAPVLILVIAIVGLVFGELAAEGAIVGQLTELFGPDGARAVQAMIASAGNEGSGTIATVVALVLLAIAATTVFSELQASLNVIWKAAPSKRSAPVALVKTRLISLSLVVAIGFLLMVSLVISAGLTAFAGYLDSLFPELDVIVRLVSVGISFTVTAVLFGMIYKILPDTRIEWQDVIVASLTAAFLFTVGKVAIGLYIGSTAVASTYGAAGALVTVLVWVYYSAQILLFGAEMAKSYARTFGSRRQRRSGRRGREPDPLEEVSEG